MKAGTLLSSEAQCRPNSWVITEIRHTINPLIYLLVLIIEKYSFIGFSLEVPKTASPPSLTVCSRDLSLLLLLQVLWLLDLASVGGLTTNP